MRASRARWVAHAFVTARPFSCFSTSPLLLSYRIIITRTFHLQIHRMHDKHWYVNNKLGTLTFPRRAHHDETTNLRPNNMAQSFIFYVRSISCCNVSWSMYVCLMTLRNGENLKTRDWKIWDFFLCHGTFFPWQNTEFWCWKTLSCFTKIVSTTFAAKRRTFFLFFFFIQICKYQNNV